MLYRVIDLLLNWRYTINSTQLLFTFESMWLMRRNSLRLKMRD